MLYSLDSCQTSYKKTPINAAINIKGFQNKIAVNNPTPKVTIIIAL
jgi:hypothetical protein